MNDLFCFKMKRFFFFYIIFSCVTVAYAQTAVWQMPPTDYSKVEPVGKDLFRVVKNGKIGLIRSDGSIVATVENDLMGQFYEHYALLTYMDGHGERISGCLSDDGRYFPFSKKYYTLNGQKFFSDGLLSVADDKGMLGYVDCFGNAVVGFDGKYKRIKPFTEGYAAVLSKEKSKYVLINKEGDEARFLYGGNGVGVAIGGCTNVYKGKAYVYDEYGEKEGKFYIYDTSTKEPLKKASKIRNTRKDYLYCYSEITGRGKEIPFTDYGYKGEKGLSPNLENGLYGFATEEGTLLPPQFTSATSFSDGYAIVELAGKYGILKYIEGMSFNVSSTSDAIKFYAGNTARCNFRLEVPNAWSSQAITVLVKDGDGTPLKVTKVGESYSFDARPSTTSQATYSVTVSAASLKLYECDLSYSFVKRELCATCGKDKTVCPYRGNHPKPQQSEKKTVQEAVCPTCGKKIGECKYQGVH